MRPGSREKGGKKSDGEAQILIGETTKCIKWIKKADRKKAMSLLTSLHDTIRVAVGFYLFYFRHCLNICESKENEHLASSQFPENIYLRLRDRIRNVRPSSLLPNMIGEDMK